MRLVKQQVVYRTRTMQRIEAERGLSMEAILTALYVERELTVDAVGKDLGITKGAASRWLERFGIQTRQQGRAA